MREPTVLRVAFYPLEGFFEYDSTGNETGYGAELLNKISEYSGIKFKYVRASSWEQTKQMITDGEADVRMPGTLPSNPSHVLDYTNQSVIDTFQIIMTGADRDDLYYDDIEKIKTLRIAAVKSFYENTGASVYLDETGIPKSSFVFFDEYSQCLKALENGQADAIATNVMDMDRSMKLLMRFNCVSNYISMKKDSPYINIIDNALYRLKIENPEFMPKLNKKWFPDRAIVPFTKEETEYIKNHRSVTVGSLCNRYPFSSCDNKTGKLSGINEDILEWISAYSGLKFDYVPLKVGEKPVESLKSGEYDIVAGILETDEFHSDHQIILSDPFITTSVSVVKRRKYNYDPVMKQTVVIKSAFEGMQSYITRNYPQYDIIYRDTDEECMDAVANFDADILIQNVYVTNYIIQKPKYEELEILPTCFSSENNCYAVRCTDDDSELLISILNKSIKMLPDDAVNSIILSNTTAKPYKFTLADIYIKYRYAIAIITVLLVLLLLLFITVGIIRRSNIKKIEMKNTQLAQVYAQAQVALRSRSDFLARMSHEIRTPMNAIIGITELAYDHSDNADMIKEDLDKISMSSKLLLSVLNDVLDMSSIESGKMKISYAEFDFKKLITSITNLYYPQCRNKKVDFQVRLSTPVDEHLMGDSLRVSQILMNLLSNAVKFTDHGQIKLTIEQKTIRDDKVYLRFTVSDTGSGMSAEMLKRVFRPFEQENAVTAQEHGGSGLGLSIVQNLVTLMNGAVAVDSHKGKGTVFTVDLPFGICSKETEKISHFEKIRVLAADDDKDAAEYVSAVLTRIGVRFTCVQTQNQVLGCLDSAKSEHDPYNVCLLDCSMPQTLSDGIIEKIREKYDKNSLVIIAAAYNCSEIDKTMIAKNADLFITKPFFQSTMFDILMSLSGGRLVKDENARVNFDFKGRRILLAEDNQMNRIVAQGLLKKGNIVCDTAENGEIAVRKFTQSLPGTYSAVLMDIQMPVMNGYDAARAIRSSEHVQAKTIPVVAMTANALSEDVSNCISSGMNAHISKPIEIIKLFETLERLWSQKENKNEF